MTTSRAIPAAALAAALFLGPAAARAGHHHGHTTVRTSRRNGHDPASCSDLTIEFDDVPAERAEVSQTIPVRGGQVPAGRGRPELRRLGARHPTARTSA